MKNKLYLCCSWETPWSRDTGGDNGISGEPREVSTAGQEVGKALQYSCTVWEDESYNGQTSV